MYLTRHLAAGGPRWAADGRFLPESFSLALLLQVPRTAVPGVLASLQGGEAASDPLLAPIEPTHEVWAAGVTYLRSREARTAESETRDVYEKVYEAARPELFFKSTGSRVSGHGARIRIRRDATWSVPEPELALVVNAAREVVGYTAGDDVSSRDIEGLNPLYLPQAKVYDGSCALGPGIRLASVEELRDLPIRLEIDRGGAPAFRGETRTSNMKRPFEDLTEHLGRELSFREGAFLMTGTGIVPPDDFTLRPGDAVRITVGAMRLENEVAQP